MKKAFYYHKSKGLFWFRFFGYGLSFQRVADVFSVREGCRYQPKLFGWFVEVLKDAKL